MIALQLDTLAPRKRPSEWRHSFTFVVWEKGCVWCDVCALERSQVKTPRTPMKPSSTGVPMERIAINVMGPLLVTNCDNKYILVITLQNGQNGMPCQTRKLKQYLTLSSVNSSEKFGVSRQLYTDWERNFESRFFQEMCRILEIDQTRTKPLRLQSDGKVELFKRTLEAMLSKFVDENQKVWDLYQPLLMMPQLSSVNESIGFLPNEMFGCKVLLPLDLFTGQAEPTRMLLRRCVLPNKVRK